MKNVLLIDDCPHEIAWFKAVVSGDADITATTNTTDALKLKRGFDFVVLDYSVIKDHGIKKFKELKKHFSCPVILTSSCFPFINKQHKQGNIIGKENLREFMESRI